MITKAMISDALRYIGMGKNQEDEQILQKVRENFDLLKKIMQPRFSYREFVLEKLPGQIMLKGTSSNIKSKDLERLFQNSQSCFILAATLGVKVDQEIARSQHSSMLDAMVLDACSSVMIDVVCDEAEEEIMKTLGQDQFLTMRFSPGYGDVPLTVSGDILELLSAGKRMGLGMTQSYMLVPTKSITALIGVSSIKENRQKSCGRCSLVTTCMYRKRGDRCGL